MKSIEDFQIKLLRRLKEFIYKTKIENFYKASLDKYYLCPYSSNKGKSKLFSYFDIINSIKFYFISSIKDFYRVSKISHFYTVSNKLKNNNEIIVVNWASIKNFDNKGNFTDNHFNIKSKNNDKILWYLIYEGKIKPNKIAKNIVLIIEKKKFFTLNSFKNIFLILFKKKLLNYFNKCISYSHILSLHVFSDIENFISKKTKIIIMPYEGQPFQNSIFLKTEKIKKSIKRLGYIHSFPSAVPANFLKRAGNPNNLIVNGQSQKDCFIKHLGWKKNEINIFPSTRFLKDKKKYSKSNIFLPINFDDEKIILNSLNFLMNNRMIDLTNTKIKNHPFSLNSRKHKNLIRKIEQLEKEQNKIKLKKSFSSSVFIGATSSVIEALERGVTNIFHICEYPELETYNKKIWKYIDTKKIKNNIFKYSITKKQKLLKLGDKTIVLKKYLAKI